MSNKFCAVAACNNSSRVDKTLSWHRFPKSNGKLRYEWIQQCKRSDPINLTNSRVCSAHFAPKDFEKNFKEQLLGTPARRCLKPTAIPTLNLERDEYSEKTTLPQTRKRKRPSATDSQAASTTSRNTKIIAKSKRTRKLGEESFMTEEIVFEVDEPNDHNYGQSMIKKVRCRGPEKGVFESSIDIIDDEDDIATFKIESTIPAESSHPTSDCSKIKIDRDEQPYCASTVSTDHKETLIPGFTSNLRPPCKIMEDDFHCEAKKQAVDAPSSTDYEASRAKKSTKECQYNQLSHQDKAAPYKSEITPEKIVHPPNLTSGEQVEKLFSPNQLKFLMKTKKRIRWTDDEIFEAIKLRLFSLPMYTYLRREKGYPFPGRLAISRWAKKMKLRGGILHSVLQIMELGRESPKNTKKHGMKEFCVLALGEMEVKETIEYDEIHDEVFGPFKKMQVMMASSLTGSWQQPVFVDFDCNIIKDTVINVIAELFSFGYHVVCFSSDCSDASVKLWKDLGASVDSPWFHHPVAKENIVVMPDAHHAIRLLRNKLLDVGFEIEGSSINRRSLDALLDLGVCSRLRPYLLQLDDNEKRRTDLAVQLLSDTVGSALNQHKPGNAEAATSTGNFLKVMNHWFNLMNVGTPELTVPFRSPYGHARREQDKLLNYVKSVMSDMKCGNNNAQESFQIGIIMSCNALPLLLNEMNELFKVEYIVTQRLNHTSIDVLFSLLSSEFSQVPSPAVALKKLQSDLFGENLGSPPEKHSVLTSVARRARIKLSTSKPCHLDVFKSSTPNLIDTILSSSKYISDNNLSHQSLNLIAKKINLALGHKYPQLRMFPNLYGQDTSSTPPKPTAYFLGNLVKMEKVFVVFTRGLIAVECKNIVSHLTRLMKGLSNSLPVEVIEIFVRLRTEIYARSLVPKLSQLVMKRRMHSKLLMALRESEEQ